MPDTQIQHSNTGWQCPVCGCGNAPFAMKCGHCVPKENNKSNFNMVSVKDKVDKLNNTNAPSFIEIEHG